MTSCGCFAFLQVIFVHPFLSYYGLDYLDVLQALIWQRQVLMEGKAIVNNSTTTTIVVDIYYVKIDYYSTSLFNSINHMTAECAFCFER